MNIGETIIIYPSPPDFRQLFQPFLKTVWSGFFGNLLELAFEGIPAVLFHDELIFSSVSILVCMDKSMYQQRKVVGFSDATAFLLVDGNISLSLR